MSDTQQTKRWSPVQTAVVCGAAVVGTGLLIMGLGTPAHASSATAWTGSPLPMVTQMSLVPTALRLPSDPASTAADQPVAKPPVDPSITRSGWYTPVRHYSFSARFGQPGSWQSGFHTGLDFVADEGAPIRAAAAGVVVSTEEAGAYGNLMKIRIKPGVEIWMAHMQSFKVDKGAQVTAGQVVGRVGMTGNTTGPHCHFEVRVKGKQKDPEDFFWPNGRSVTRLK